MAKRPKSAPSNAIRYGVEIEVGLCYPNPRNYQRHGAEQIANLRTSLREFDQVQCIIVQDDGKGRYVLVAGHGVHRAAILERFETLWANIIPADWPAERVLAYMGADNELARQADPDQAQLAALVADVHEKAEHGLAVLAAGSERRLAELAAGVQGQGFFRRAGEDPGPQGGDAPERLLATWAVELGQVWEVPSRSVPGAVHRLRCGDSRDRYQTAALMAGAVADWVWTDPPYGVDYTGRTADALTVEGDQEVDLEPLLSASFAAMDHFLTKGCPLYVAHPCGPNTEVYMRCWREVGWHLHQDLVWVKQHFVMARTDYQQGYEPVLYGWKPGADPVWLPEEVEEDGGDGHYAMLHNAILYGWKPGARRPWYGRRTKNSVIFVDRPMRSTFHPTAKPPSLVAVNVQNSSKVHSLGLDPFVGWGSTIVAGERTGRVVFAQDIAPKYIAASLERLALMGLRPYLAEDAQGHRQKSQEVALHES